MTYSLLKRIIPLVILFTFLLIVSCNSNETITEPEDQIWLKGKIENWTEGSDKIIRLGINIPNQNDFGSSIISQSGDFGIVPKPPAKDLLTTELMYYEPYLDPKFIYVSRPDIKGRTAFLSVTENNKMHEIGFVNEQNTQNTEVGSFGIHYVYAEDSLTIKGSRIYYSESIDTLEMVYNLNYKKGWNQKADKTLIFKTVNGKISYLKIEYTTDIPSGAKWFYSKID